MDKQRDIVVISRAWRYVIREVCISNDVMQREENKYSRENK